MKDFQVVSSLTQLKALVAGLYGRIDELGGAAAAPAVDFAVDMFDRQNQDTLGPYWSNTEYAVRDSVVIRTSGTAPLVSVANLVFTTLSLSALQFGIPVYCMWDSEKTPGISGSGAAVYSADLTSSDFTCRVTSTIPAYINQPPPGVYAGRSLSHLIPDGSPTSAYAQVGAGAGVCVANATGGVFGVGTQSAVVPFQSVQSSTGFASTPGGVRSDIAVGAESPVNTVADAAISSISPVDSFVIAYQWAGKFDAMAVGSNTITANSSGDAVIIDINGVPFFSGTPATVSRKSRTRAGIMTGPYNAAAGLAAATNAGVGGVTSFKAWRNDIPEPPNETGHGTYVNGRWQYTDKYHTPNTDAEGNVIRNEDGTVASYTYDPEA